MSLKDKVIEALKKVYDPEIPVNVYDLGLIYDLEVNNSEVKVKMTLTAPSCPLGSYLPSLIEEVIKQNITGVKNISIELVWDPPWSPLRVTEDGRRRLKEIYGVDVVEEWLKRANKTQQ
ncbi:MAG: iron-sulfur cluster assembly protein [Thermofilaceae archaeon]